MRKRALIFTGMVGVLTAGVLAGCSGATSGGTGTVVKSDVTAEELVKTASEKAKDVNYVEFDMDVGMDYEMSASGTSMNMKMEGDISGESVKEPTALHMKMDMDINALGMQTKVDNEAYLTPGENGKSISYSKESEDGQEGTWTKTEVESSDTFDPSVVGNLSFYEKIADGSVKAELEETNEKINGKDVYKINATITGDVFEETMSGLSGGSDTSGMLGGGDMSDMEIDADIYIYKDSGHTARVYMDAAEAAKKMFEESLSSAGQSGDFDLKVNEYYVDLTYDNYDAYTTIEVPAEVIQAAQ